MANRRIALLIATDTYADDEFTDLRTPCTDASALASLLGDPAIGAFEVTTLQNRPAQEVRQTLDETFTDAHRDDLVLLHISGHGIKDESGKLHLVMSDTRRRHLRASAIAASWVCELIDHSDARRVVVWLDCCYSGAFPPGFRPKGSETVDAIDQLAGDSGRGCAVMTASTKLQYAYERDEMSLFTQAITEGLRGGAADLNEDGRIDANELYSFVYDWVRGRTPDQTPTRNDVVSGDIYIAQSGQTAQLPLELPAEIRQLLRSQDERFRKIGKQELEKLAATGDLVAASALSALAGARPALPSSFIQVEPHTLPRFGYAHSFKILSKAVFLPRRGTSVMCAAFSPIDPELICLGTGKTMEFVNALKRKTRSRSIDSGDGPRALAFSPDGQWLVTSNHHETSMWNPYDQEKPVWTGPGASAVAFSPDSAIVATSTSHTITLRNSTTGSPLGALHDDRIVGKLAFSPDNGMLAAAYEDMVRLWDAQQEEPIGQPLHHEEPVQSVVFSPNGKMLATSSNRTVQLWDPSSGRQLSKPMKHTSAVYAIAFSLDGHALVSATGDGDVEVWDPYTSKLLQMLSGHALSVTSVGFSSDGKHMGSVDFGGEFILWERTR